MIDDLRPAVRELEKPFGVNRVVILPVVHVVRLGIGVVVANEIHPTENLRVLGVQDGSRVVGLSTVEVAVPGAEVDVVTLPATRANLHPVGGHLRERLESPAVAVVLRHIPDLRGVVRRERPVRRPAVVGMAMRDEEPSVHVLAQVDDAVQLAARDVEVREVAADERGVHRRDRERLDDRHEPVRPPPPVVPAPPLAVHRLANPARRAYVIRTDPVVLLDAVAPRLQVVEHPRPVLLLAGEQVRVGHETGRREIQRDVAPHLSPVERVEDDRVDLVVVPVCLLDLLVAPAPLFALRGYAQVVERHGIPGEHRPVSLPVVEGVLEPRAAAARDRRPDHLSRRIPVLRLRVFPGVEPREANRTGAIRLAGRVGKTEVVEVDRRLAVVHPVVVRVELAVDLTVVGELTRNRLPVEPRQLVDLRRPAQRVEERPVVVALVPVVGAVHPGPLVAPDEASVGSRVAARVQRCGLVHRVDQVTLARRPVGNRLDRLRFNVRHGSSGFRPL